MIKEHVDCEVLEMIQGYGAHEISGSITAVPEAVATMDILGNLHAVFPSTAPAETFFSAGLDLEI